jgi:hypothetical protein
MPTIDLTTPPAAPEGTLEGLPRRVALTLPELRFLAEKAGGAPLPFDPADPGEHGERNPLESRLGQTRGAADHEAYLSALGTLHDPIESLTRRGLLVEDPAGGVVADEGVVGALGLLATPATAVDLDVVLDRIRGRAWHRQRGNAVATLATTDGLVFELAWFDSEQWPGELGRVTALSEDLNLEPSAAPELVDLPYELLDAGAEALRSGRSDLLGTIVAHHSGAVIGPDGAVVDDAAVTALVSGLVAETQGRLRAMIADIDAGGAVVGVVSWVLLADGWRHLRAHQTDGARRVEVRRVQPAELAASLGPVLAEVTA